MIIFVALLTTFNCEKQFLGRLIHYLKLPKTYLRLVQMPVIQKFVFNPTSETAVLNRSAAAPLGAVKKFMDAANL